MSAKRVIGGDGGCDLGRILRHAVVLIDPMLNPDGRDRFVDWVNGNRSGTVGLPSLDGADRERLLTHSAADVAAAALELFGE